MKRILFLLLMISANICTGEDLPPDFLIAQETIDFSAAFFDDIKTSDDFKKLSERIINASQIESIIAENYVAIIDKSIDSLMNNPILFNTSHPNDVMSGSNDASSSSQSQNNILYKKISLNDYISSTNNTFHRFVEALKIIEYENNTCHMIRQKIEEITLWNSFSSINRIFCEINFSAIFDNIMHTLGGRSSLSVVNRCDSNITFADEFIRLYELMASTERKAFLISGFMNQATRICSPETTSTIELFELKDLMTHRVQSYLRSLKLVLLYIPTDIYRCDTLKYISEPTPYIHLEGYKRAVIINEEYIRHEDTCWYHCEQLNDYQQVSQADLDARKDYCPGKLLNCKTLGTVDICHKSRRLSHPINWFKSQNGKIYGRPTNCKNNMSFQDTWLWFGSHCDNCACTCDDGLIPSPTRYAFSLLEEVSNILENRVITGIRFSNKERMIHPQIETGILIAKGHIEANSTHWKEVNSVKGNRFPKTNHDQLEFVRLGSGLDEVEYVDLENIYLDKDEVLTGVRFETTISSDIYDVHKSRLSISLLARATKFDFKTGKLEDNSEWVSVSSSIDTQDSVPPNSPFFHRRELRLDNTISPLESHVNVPDSTNGQYVKFWQSDLEKDAGQSTVPFIDGIPVYGTPRIPLGGIGIHHKGAPNTGGYIAFRIMGIDKSSHIRPEVGLYYTSK